MALLLLTCLMDHWLIWGSAGSLCSPLHTILAVEIKLSLGGALSWGVAYGFSTVRQSGIFSHSIVALGILKDFLPGTSWNIHYLKLACHILPQTHYISPVVKDLLWKLLRQLSRNPRHRTAQDTSWSRRSGSCKGVTMDRYPDQVSLVPWDVVRGCSQRDPVLMLSPYKLPIGALVMLPGPHGIFK